MNQEPGVIAASTVGVRTMADGTLRLTVDIEPAQSKSAFNLFGAPGTQLAVAALIVRPKHSAREESDTRQTTKAKGGELAKLAAMWCESEDFWRWCTSTFTDADVVTNSSEAASLVRFMCGISSRAQLDQDQEARAAFNRIFRVPYGEHLRSKKPI